MASIAIVGKSGTGKSTSYAQVPEVGIKGLDPKETVIVNVASKDLPMRAWKKLYAGKLTENGNYVDTSDASVIAKAIDYISSNREDIKNIVVDDSQYILSFEFMRRAKEKGYDKYSELGVNINKVLESARNCRKDLKVYFLWHPEIDKDNGYKLKTIGAMLDNYITLEGLFTVILYTQVSKGENNKMKYEFVTNNDGSFPSKSPLGMFKDLYIPNDLGLVSEIIDKYNEGE
jgi:hypothetical protein